MNYVTCFNCDVPKQTCPRRSAIGAALKGLRISSVKFPCPDRKAKFAVGQRVAFDWTWWEEGDGMEDGLPLTFTGTVLRDARAKFVVQVDRGTDCHGEGIKAEDVFRKNDQLLIKVRPADMRPLDEPARRICPTCFFVEGVAEDRCYRSPGVVFNPKGCIATSPQSAGQKEGRA